MDRRSSGPGCDIRDGKGDLMPRSRTSPGGFRRKVGDLTDADGFRTFYDRTLPKVYSYHFHRIGGIRSVAEDLTQETFTAAVSEIQAGRHVDRPDRWVMGIARHKLLDHYRAKAREEERMEAITAAAATRPHVVWQGPEDRERALEALAAVPEAQRAALALRYLEDLSVPGVAEVLGRSIHATESLLARGRENFRRHYTGGGNGQG
jgi:RNA polymerase sigma-70 factor (ECF subfamily)